MCIICVSPKGTPQPTRDQIRRMFEHNPHGAGYMVARNGAVQIHKGFTDLQEFQLQVDRERFTPEDVVVYHFRISTQAGTTPEMTHPFPLSSKLEHMTALDITCPCGVAHNGVIHLTSNGNPRYSDTALFITQYMTRIIRKTPDLHDQSVLRILEELTKSRLAILDKTGHVATVGKFIHESNGLMFSNTSYLEFTWNPVNFSRYRGFSLQEGV